jgi:serine/threonine protein kinase
MKVIRKDQLLQMKNGLKGIIKEKELLLENNHPFLIKMEYGFQNEERLFFVMDLIEGGDLYDHFRKVDRFPEKQVKFYIS